MILDLWKECQRCGRKLKDLNSRIRGYGKRCWEVIQLERAKDKFIKNSEITTLMTLPSLDKIYNKINNLENQVNFLKCENKMIKTQIKQLKTNNIKNTKIIERIKKDENRTERDGNKVNMIVVIKELKVVLEERKGKNLKTDFKFSDEDLGIKTPEEIIQLISN